MIVVRQALRNLRGRPLSSAVVVLVLGLGIGANTTMFSTLDSVLFDPLPFPGAGDLVWVWGRSPEGRPNTLSALSYLDYRQESASFEGMAAFLTFPEEWVVSEDGDPEVLVGLQASWNLLETLGLSPVTGRGFQPADENLSSPPVVMISEGLWGRRYDRDPAIIGTSLPLGDASCLIAGVVPKELDLLATADLWRPIRLDDPMARGRGNNNFNVFGRLQPGVAIQAADAEMKSIAAGMAAEFPESQNGWSVSLQPLQELIVGGVQGMMYLLTGAVGLVLLVACGNLAALLLARAAGRGGEVAVRTALGASRSQLFRQFLAESSVLAAAGGLVGLLIAGSLLRAIQLFGPAHVPRLGEIGLDTGSLAFTAILTLATASVFGLIPALFFSRHDILESLKGTGRSGGLRGTGRLLGGLVVAQSAISLVLILAAGLLVRSLQQLRDVDPGFQAEDLVTAEVRLPARPYGEDLPTEPYWEGILESVRSIPGVEKASLTSSLPVVGGFGPWNTLWAEGRQPENGSDRQGAIRRLAAPEYFQAMGIPLLRGRGFTDLDGLAGPRVTVISESMADLFFPGQDAVGKGIILWESRWEVVGVAGDVRMGGLGRDIFPTFYLPVRQVAVAAGGNLVLRTRLAPAALASVLKESVRASEPGAAVTVPVEMRSMISSALGPERFRTLLLSSFAGVALLLVALGLYGVLGYSVNMRRRELGLRLALGATGGDLVRLTLEKGLSYALAGIGLGVAGGLGIAQMMEAMLFGVSALDPVTFLLGPAVLLGVAFLASLGPALKTSVADPVESLRRE